MSHSQLKRQAGRMYPMGLHLAMSIQIRRRFVPPPHQNPTETYRNQHLQSYRSLIHTEHVLCESLTEHICQHQHHLQSMSPMVLQAASKAHRKRTSLSLIQGLSRSTQYSCSSRVLGAASHFLRLWISSKNLMAGLHQKMKNK